jgi:hypothetical protein
MSRDMTTLSMLSNYAAKNDNQSRGDQGSIRDQVMWNSW